ncbi:uncharacterized protein TNCV_4588011 [Trichonephila clavipes]|uniref:Secreted protein n=1 Tax=Trichonephila clavipes TaxID=2585209 RepID=A0A8X6VEK2_TRICX|nr:uncharacterized protein TNCV_4588011 [Trichonephila clavipes]
MTTTSYRVTRRWVFVTFSVQALLCCRSRLGARGTMTTTSYRGRAAVGVRHLFSVEALLCCPVASWCTRNDDNDILPRTLGGGCSSPFSVEALLCCPVASCCTRNDDNDILPRTRGGGCSYPFFRRGTTLLSGRVLVHAERWQRHPTAGTQRWVFVIFFRRGNTLVSGCVLLHAERSAARPVYSRSRLGARGTMSTLPRPRGAGCLSNFFRPWHYPAVRSRLGARGTMITKSYRVRAAVGVRHLFSVEALLCSPVASLFTRNDDNDNLPRTLSGGCSSFFPSRQYSGVRLRLVARGTMTTNPTADARRWVFVSFFRRDTTVLSGRVLVHAERWQRHPTAGTQRWVFVTFFPSRHYSAVRSHLGARGTMTTTTYRGQLGGGCSSLFYVEALLCCPVASWCMRKDDNDMLPRPHGGGCSSPFPSRHNSAVRSCLVAGGTMTTTSYRGRAAVGFRILFLVETLPCCPVASWCTRNDGNDILPQALSGGCSSFFPSRQYSGVRLRLVARGTMTTTSYRSRSAEGVRHFFVEAQLCSPIASWCTRNDVNFMLPRPRGGGVCQIFPSLALPCCSVASWCTRNDDNDNPTATARRWVFVTFFRRGTTLQSWHLGARGTMITTFFRSRSAEGHRHFFRRGTTLLSDIVLVRAERCQLYATASARRGCLSNFSVPGITQLSGSVLVYRSHSAVGVRHFFRRNTRSRHGAS